MFENSNDMKKILFAAVAAIALLVLPFAAPAAADQRTSIAVTQHQGIGVSYSAIKLGRLEAGPVALVKTGTPSSSTLRGGLGVNLYILPNVAVGATFVSNKPSILRSPSFSEAQLTLSVRI